MFCISGKKNTFFCSSIATSLEKYVEKMHQKTGIIPKIPQVKKEEQVTVNNDSLLDEHMLSQLQAVFSRMENPIILKLLLNESTLSNELKGYMEALALQTDKIKIAIEKTNQEIPSVNICLEDGKLLSKKKEAKSYYKGHEAIIAVGTMKVEQVPETALPPFDPACLVTCCPSGIVASFSYLVL